MFSVLPGAMTSLRMLEELVSTARAVSWRLGAVVQDEGAYLRVMSPGRCVLTRARVEDALGAPVQFPGDLEVVMSSFAGRMRLTEDEAMWWIVEGASATPSSSEAE